MKRIIGVYRNQNMHWVGDGFPVKNLFSYDRLGQAISPFLLLDYAAPYTFAPSHEQHGVGSHPHRGFETVTLAYQGEVTHKDSHGGGGTIKTGDVQWMTAGAGLVHEEFHSHEFTEKGGIFEMVQLWVNLPAVNVWDGQLKAGHEQIIHVPVDHNTLVVVLEGEMLLNGTQKVLDSSIVMFEKDGDAAIQLEAVQDAKFLVLTGKPLNEPIQGYGPFVMNSKEEIVQAFNDFNNGKFGEIVAEA
jgi:redox-sensitive bicupin YhaK (pirin superfamily)